MRDEFQGEQVEWEIIQWNTIQQQKPKELELQVVMWINLKNIMLNKVCLLYCIVYINLKKCKPVSSIYCLKVHKHVI